MNHEKWMMEWFEASYRLYLSKQTKQFDPKKFDTDSTDFINYQNLSQGTSAPNIAVVKLNGGLGTSMGCSGPKSLIPCTQNGKTFMDLIVEQFNSIPHKGSSLIFLNSFNTSNQTNQFLTTNYPNLNYSEVMQHEFYRIKAVNDQVDESSFAPPGHGSVYYDLYYSGTLNRCLDEGIDYLFISNADNLAATYDARIASYIADHNIPFLIELTSKSDAYVKGGTIIKSDNQFHLWESAQVCDKHLPLFQSQPYFNTNNIWVHVSSLIELIETQSLHLDLIQNSKTIGDKSYIQLEYAMGSAIQSFVDAKLLVSPRSRFFPVKKMGDYLLLISDFCDITDNGQLVWDQSCTPIVDCLPPFDRIDNFDAHVKVVPSLKNVSKLTLGGPVYFESHVSISGDLSIIAADNAPLYIYGQSDLPSY